MKKIIIILIVLTACIIGGSSVIRPVLQGATNGDRPLENVNYNYLPSPKLISADANHVYVLSDANNENTLLILDRISGVTIQKVILSATNNFSAKYIKVIGNYVFIVGSFVVDDFIGFELLSVNIANEFAQASATLPTHDYVSFHISEGDDETCNFLYATLDEIYLSTLYFADLTTIEQVTPIPTTLNISSACFSQSTGQIYMLASENSTRYRIYGLEIGLGEPKRLFAEFFYHTERLEYYDEMNCFVFISSDQNPDVRRLTLYNGTDESVFAEYENSSKLESTLSKKTTDFEIANSAQEPEIVVLDEVKNSIDSYKTNGADLTFSRVVAGTKGTRDGFYDDPTAMCIAREGEYFVATTYGIMRTDLHEQISLGGTETQYGVQTQFIARDPSTEFEITAMTFDGNDTLYAYDVFTEDERPRITAINIHSPNTDRITYMTDSDGQPLSKIYALVATSAQEVYAIGTKIYKLSSKNAAFVDITPSSYPQLSSLKVAFSERDNLLFILDASDHTTVYALDLSTYKPSISDITINQSSFNSPVLDIVCDSLGGILALSNSTPLSIQRYTYDINPAPETDSLALDSSFEPYELATNPASATSPTTSINPSLCFDKLSNRIYYLNAHDGIEFVDFETNEIWNFKGKETANWNNKNAQSATNSRFARAQKQVLLHEFPGTSSRAYTDSNTYIFNAGTVFNVLERNAVVGGESFSNYSLVMYEINSATTRCVGYVLNHDINLTFSDATPTMPYDFAYSSPNFRVVQGETNIGRTIYSNTPIYKFPSRDLQLVIGVIEINYRLRITAKVMGTSGFEFYEVYVTQSTNEEGITTYQPSQLGECVGYVVANIDVIDFFEPERGDHVPNAKIKASGVVKIYVFDPSGNLIETPDTLISGTQIKVLGISEIKSGYSEIVYFDAELDQTKVGYIETKYIVMNGITTLQIVAMTFLIIMAGCACIICVFYIKNRRNQY